MMMQIFKDSTRVLLLSTQISMGDLKLISNLLDPNQRQQIKTFIEFKVYFWARFENLTFWFSNENECRINDVSHICSNMRCDMYPNLIC